MGTYESTLAPQTSNFALDIGVHGASGTLDAATGLVLVTGTGSLLNLNNNPMAVGGASTTATGGNGSLTITSGGSVAVGTPDSNLSGALAVGKAVGSTGSVTISGTGSNLMVDGSAHFGRGGFGELLVENSGTATFGAAAANGGGLGIGAGASSAGQPIGGTGVATVTQQRRAGC